MTTYATSSDLARLGVAAAALSGLSEDDKAAALASASSVADGYLASRFRLPLTAWGDDIRLAVCRIAALILMSSRGFSPEDPAGVLYVELDKAARNWLHDVSVARVTPVVTETVPAVMGSSRVTSNTPRGW